MKLLHGHSEIEIKFDTDGGEWENSEPWKHSFIRIPSLMFSVHPWCLPTALKQIIQVLGSLVFCFWSLCDKVKLRNTFSPSPPGSHSIFIVLLLKKYQYQVLSVLEQALNNLECNLWSLGDRNNWMEPTVMLPQGNGVYFSTKLILQRYFL